MAASTSAHLTRVALIQPLRRFVGDNLEAEMILEVRHLRLVEAVSEHGSLTRASFELHLTQSALSHQLLELEGRLRTMLFHRTGKRMEPTYAGLRVLEVARRVLPRMTALEEELRGIAAGRKAVLRLSTECYTSYHWLPSVMEAFRQRAPEVDVQIVAEATTRPVDALLEGRLDLGIVYEEREDDRLAYTPLFQDELVAVLRPDHRLADRPYLEASDLAEEHLILYNSSRTDQSVLRSVFVPAGIDPYRVSTIQLTEGIVEMVKAALGVSVLARWAVAPHVAAGVVLAIPLTHRGVWRRWSAVTLRTEAPRAHLHEFIRLLARGPALLGGDESRVKVRVSIPLSAQGQPLDPAEPHIDLPTVLAAARP